MTAGDVDAACRDVIEAAGHGGQFVHGTGHGLGLEIHERPILSPRSAATLTAHMTVTVEPGLYLPGVGGVRIEDVVAVLPSGPRVLTTAITDLVVL
jgi:Xaa-Pro aminopeptidase